MNSVAADIKYALRLWKKSPGFVAIAVGTLALGISANTIIFTGVEAFLLRPLPIPDSESVVFLREVVRKTGAQMRVAYADLLDWREGAPALEHIAAIQIDTFNLGGSGEPERLRGSRVSAEYFGVMGLAPLAGRVFTAEEDRPGAAPVVVLGHEFAQRRFGGLDAAGKTLTIDGRSYMVVGVMPPSMRFPMGFADLWIPLAVGPGQAVRGNYAFAAIGRLRAGATLSEAKRQLDAVSRNIEAAHPATNKDMGVAVVPLSEQISSGPRRAILVLWIAVGFVLLICCANLANLTLARALYRSREFAVRQALGASRWQILRQVLIESLLLSCTGGALGVLLAGWGVEFLSSVMPSGLQPMGGLALNATVLAFTCSLSVVTGIAFGLLPALRTMRTQAGEALREGGRSIAGGHTRNRMARALVVGEVALAVTLLAGAGILLTALRRIQTQELGFDASRVLTAEIATKGGKYESAETQTLTMDALLEGLAATPGVTAAAAVNFPPMTTTSSRAYAVDGQPAVQSGRAPMADYRVATPAYAAAMSIPVLQGRFFTADDRRNTESVAVVNQRFASAEWPGQNPVGRLVSLYTAPGKLGPRCRVVGMVANVRHSGPTADPTPEVYLPLAQAPEASVYLTIQTAGDPAALIPALHSVVKSVDPGLPLSLVRPMERVIADRIAPARYTTLLLGALSVVALLLATLGLYGVISYLVARRTYEFGVRLALGATQGGLLRLVLRGSLALTGIGTIIGLASAFGVSRLLASVLPGVRAEAGVFAGIAGVLAVVAMGAAWFPLRRALASGPLQALRSE